MNILITGGLGFIGRALVRQLLAEGGHKIRIVDLLTEQVHGADPVLDSDIADATEIVIADIRDSETMVEALEGIELVYHLAAETGTGQSMYEIETYFGTNVQGTATLLEAMVKSPTARPSALVLASSRSIYGEGAYEAKGSSVRHYPVARTARDMEDGHFDFEVDGVALHAVATRESDPPDPRSHYATSKLTQEYMCQVACESLNIRFKALRLQNVYGPGQSLRNPYTGILSIFTNILRQGGTIDIFEDGRESRDFVFVDDVARAFRNAADLAAATPDIINVGTGEPVSVTSMVAMLEAKLETSGRSAISGRFRPGDIRHNWADTALMHAHLGLGQLTPLQEGLSATVDWALTQPIEEDRSARATAELGDFLKGK